MLATEETDRPDTFLENLGEVARLACRAYVERVDLDQLLPAACGGLIEAEVKLASHGTEASHTVLARRDPQFRRALEIFEEAGRLLKVR